MGDESPKMVGVIGDASAGPSRSGVDDSNNVESFDDDRDNPDDPGGTKKSRSLQMISCMEERLQARMERGLAGAVVELKQFTTESITERFMQAGAPTQGDPLGGRTTQLNYPRSIKATRSESDSGTDVEDRDASGERPAKRFAHPRYITSYEHGIPLQQGERDSSVPLQQGERASPGPDTRVGSPGTSRTPEKIITSTELVYAVEKITTSMDKPKEPLPTFSSGESKREFSLFLKLFHKGL